MVHSNRYLIILSKDFGYINHKLTLKIHGITEARCSLIHKVRVRYSHIFNRLITKIKFHFI